MDKDAKVDEDDKPVARRGSASSGSGRSFKRVNHVLNNVMTKLGLDRRLREHTLVSLWPAVVGNPWSERSRPIFIDADAKLVVAVADASTGQELSLLKSDILRKLKGAGRSIGIDISGIRFDLKHYHGAHDDGVLLTRAVPHYPVPTGEELAGICLEESDLAEIAALEESLASESQPAQPVPYERIVSVFASELKLRHWMRQNGFPSCPACNNPCRSLHGPERLCVACFWGGR